MNTRHHNRVHNGRSVLRSWLAGAIASTRRPLEPRRLGCERLERRYALDGMGWFEESFQASEYRDTNDRYGQSERGQNAIVRSFDRSGYLSGATQTRFQRIVLDGYRLHGQVSEESLWDVYEHDCDRPRGMRGEGEGPGELPIRLGQRPDQGLSSRPIDANSAKPEPKLESVQSAGNSTRSPLDLKEPTRPAQDHAIPATVAEVAKPTLPTGSSNVPRLVIEVSSQPRTGLINLLGARDNVRLPAITNQNDQGSFASGASVDLNRGGAMPWLTSNQTGAAFVSDTTLLRANADTSSESSASGSFTTIQTSDGTTRDRLVATTNLSHRTLAASSSTLADTESTGLLEQLRSVIEKLASERQADKPEMASSNRLHHSQSSAQSGQFASSNRKQIVVEDGMLELAAATDKLTTSTLITADGTASRDAVQHRSQLLASLELNREFDLAGQATRAMEEVVDPTEHEHVHAIDEAVAAVAQWSSASAGDSADQSQSSGSLWQRSLLPLSFLALGGILLRKKNRAKRRAELLSGPPAAGR